MQLHKHKYIYMLYIQQLTLNLPLFNALPKTIDICSLKKKTTDNNKYSVTLIASVLSVKLFV